MRAVDAEHRVIFLHLPKTAGQSVHAYLERLFGSDAVAPARINSHLAAMTIADIHRYRVYSGHLDWTLLDCLPRPRFTFSIFRDPMDRVLSFYFFLRSEGRRLANIEKLEPHQQGLRAALNMTPDEYFVSKTNGIRAFLDNNYDNFYAHYFAGRTFDGRQRLMSLPPEQRTDERIIAMALANIARLKGVYTLDGLDLLEADLQLLSPHTGASGLQGTHVNKGDGTSSAQRMERLRELGATAATFERLNHMTRLDNVIWSHVHKQVSARRPAPVRGAA
jgi:hypothetical protein